MSPILGPGQPPFVEPQLFVGIFFKFYIAGHRLGYSDTDSFFAFWDLDKLENGDEVILTDANGTKYTYEVYEEFVVEPTDLYVTEPVEGKNIVTLQTCTLPDYADRLIVRVDRKQS